MKNLPRWQALSGTESIGDATLRARLEEGIPAQIPGTVHEALLTAGCIDDPFYADRALDLQWIEHIRWALVIPVMLETGFDLKHSRLVLDGVDTFAKVFLNGIAIGETRNALRRYSLPAGTAAVHGTNELRLEFLPVAEAIGPEAKIYPSAFGDPVRVHVRRMQCTFGWDWVHRFVTYGLSEPPLLTGVPSLLFPACLTNDITGQVAVIHARWETEAIPAGAGYMVDIRLRSPDGAPLLRQCVPADSRRAVFEIPSPLLWFPRGYGDQPLYSCTWTLLLEDTPCGNPLTIEFGIREVALLTAPDRPGSPEEEMTRKLAQYQEVPPERGQEFGFRINGVEVFALGGNWVPCSPFAGAAAESRKKEILRTFAASGANALRVWGGGIYESDGFYHLCDKLGIMVLQDFMMACADYPADNPAFLENLGPEIVQAVQRLRKHASIIHWFGDNENGMRDSAAAQGRPWWEIFDQIVRPALRDFDGTRPATPTSPYFGNPNTSALQGDSHLSGLFTDDRAFFLGDMRNYKERLDSAVGRFMSENALFGAPSIESLLRFIPEDRLDDPGLWEFHTKDNPYHPPEVDLTLFQSLEKTAATLFGDFTTTSDRLHKLACVHYEAVRLAVEAARRKQPFCRGVLFWMLNDCWPASGWSLIDYYVRPKAGYYGLLHAAHPVHCSFRTEGRFVEAWASNFHTRPASRDIRVFFESWDGKTTPVATLAATIPAGGSCLLTRFDPSIVPDTAAGVFHAVTEEDKMESGWYFHGMPREMMPPPASLQIRQTEPSDSGWTLDITTDSYARVVTLRGPIIPGDNYFDLRAGETRRISLTPEKGFTGPIGIEAWNAPYQPIPLPRRKTAVTGVHGSAKLG